MDILSIILSGLSTLFDVFRWSSLTSTEKTLTIIAWVILVVMLTAIGGTALYVVSGAK